VIHLLTQACRSLHEAHDKGLVHRDVKAANLVLCRRALEHDVVKVMDFGLVRDTKGPSETGFGQVVGSPETMSPEVIVGEPATPRSDLYALAAVGVQLLTGRPLFDGTTLSAVLTAHLQQDPERPSARVRDVPADLEGVLLACLAKDPEERPESAAALESRLLACADAGRWTSAQAAAWWERHGASFPSAASSASGRFAPAAAASDADA
jgi:serine/threonine-protein kinase